MSEKLFTIRTPDARLAAALHSAGGDSIVILAHGYTGSKIESGRLFVSAARALASAGINALRFDFFGSGDSSGEFFEMTPNTEIRDLLEVIAWCRGKRYRRIGLLGLSLGGAISICTAARSRDVAALVTWSAVPEFASWRVDPDQVILPGNPLTAGKNFYADRPPVDVPEAYCSLRIPKLQIQGTDDLPGFLDGFARYFPDAPDPKEHRVLPGADHVFTTWSHRKEVIALTVDWFSRNL